MLQAEGAGASPDEPARAGRVVAEAGLRVDFRARRVELLLLLEPPPPVLGGESNADTVAWHSLVLDLGHAVVPQRSLAPRHRREGPLGVGRDGRELARVAEGGRGAGLAPGAIGTLPARLVWAAG